nr:hypothetical protein Iba_chr09bCG13960 [Ipomoea batatas]
MQSLGVFNFQHSTRLSGPSLSLPLSAPSMALCTLSPSPPPGFTLLPATSPTEVAVLRKRKCTSSHWSSSFVVFILLQFHTKEAPMKMQVEAILEQYQHLSSQQKGVASSLWIPAFSP